MSGTDSNAGPDSPGNDERWTPPVGPVGVLAPLIEYACPPGGLLIDPVGEATGSMRSLADRGMPTVILGTEGDGRLTKVRSIVPESELYRYSTTLYSLTHGRGTRLITGSQLLPPIEEPEPDEVDRLFTGRERGSGTR